MRCRLGVVKPTCVGKETRHLGRRHVAGVGKDSQRRQARAEVADRCGGGLGERLHVRCDHAGPDQRVESGGAVYTEVSQVYDGMHELLGPALVQDVQQRRPPGSVGLEVAGRHFPQQHRELLVDAVWQVVDQIVCELRSAERHSGPGGGKDYLRSRGLLPARVPVRRRQSAVQHL